MTARGFAATLRYWLSRRSRAARSGLGLAIRRPALQSLNTQQTKRRDLFLQARSQRKLGRFGKRALLLAASLLSSMTVAHAHTVSVGYEALGGGVFDIWYGTYHSPSEATYTEGSLQFTGPSISTTVAFTMLTYTKPSGLIDGTTNFYSNAAGTGLTGTPVPITGNGGSFNGLASGVLAWQGVQFTGIIRPGTYTFTYIPIANPTQVWDPINNAILTGSFTISAQTLGTTFTGLLPPGSPTNVTNLAAALDNFATNGGTLPAAFQNLYDLPGPQLAAALGELSGETAADAEKGAFELMNQFLGLMLDPFVDGRSCGGGFSPVLDPLRQELGCGDRQASGFASDQQASFPPDIALAYAGVLKAPPAVFTPRWTAWGSGFGGASTTNGNAALGSNNVTARDYGFAAGMDYHATPSTLYGFALAGGGTNWGLAQGLGSGRSDAFQAGVYGKNYFGPAYVSGALAFTNNWMTTDRSALGDQITAHFNGQSYGGRLETGYSYGVATSGPDNDAASYSIGVTPYAALQTQWFHTPTYSETDLAGGGLGLTYNAMTANDTRSELGAHFEDLTLLDAMPIVLRARLAWAHDWVTYPALDAVFQSLPGTSFVVNGANPPPNSALTSAGAELYMTPVWSLGVKFDGEFAPGSQTYAGSATLRYKW
jgi:Autotransporter beta-domain